MGPNFARREPRQRADYSCTKFFLTTQRQRLAVLHPWPTERQAIGRTDDVVPRCRRRLCGRDAHPQAFFWCLSLRTRTWTLPEKNNFLLQRFYFLLVSSNIITTKFQLYLQFFAHATLLGLKTGLGFQYIINIITVVGSGGGVAVANAWRLNFAHDWFCKRDADANATLARVDANSKFQDPHIFDA